MNLLVDTDQEGIIENAWPGRRLRIGSAEVEVTARALRCVMTTLPQSGMPRDRGILARSPSTTARSSPASGMGLPRRVRQRRHAGRRSLAATASSCCRPARTRVPYGSEALIAAAYGRGGIAEEGP